MRSYDALESWVYGRVIEGIPGFAPLESMTQACRSRHECRKKQVTRLVRWHAMHAGSVALLTSWGGFATLPIACSVGFVAEQFLAFRLAAGVAALHDWPLQNDDTFRMIRDCVAGRTVTDIDQPRRSLTHQIARHVANGVGGELVNHGQSLLVKQIGKSSLKPLSRAVPVVAVAFSVGLDARKMFKLGERAHATFRSTEAPVDSLHLATSHPVGMRTAISIPIQSKH